MRRATATALAAFLVLGLSAAPAAATPSNTHLADHGWTCLTAGPNDWVHCFPPGFASSDRTITVRVFDSTDVDIDGAQLGTELLIHDEVFAGQRCPQDGGNYGPLAGTPYWACHRFDT